MSIDPADIRVYRAAIMDDTASNGGRQSWVEAVDNAPDNLWPPIGESERLAGFDKYRKHFWRVQDGADQTASNVKIVYDGPTPAADAIYAFPATMTDTQGDLTGSERLYGSGFLEADVSAGGTTVTVTLEDPSRTIFADGDTIRIDDGTTGEWLVISGTPSLNGSTLTITTSTQLLNSYTVANSTRISSTIIVGDVEASISNPVPTSASGTIDDTAIIARNIGSEHDSITLTFTSSTVFNAIGTNLGSLGSGNITSDFAPVNPSSPGPGSALFTIPSTAWGGTWTSGDTFVFDLNPPAVPIWERRIAAPGAAGSPDNARTMKFHYE